MIEIKVRKLTTWKEKTEGLLAFAKPEPVIFETRFGIHTFFMKYPIDVLILDREGRVVKLKTYLKPFRIYFWNPYYNKILELPKGTIREKKIKLGDTLRVVSAN
jgi:uncharacterized membrane protein (UPF0127 family)